jgi:predicted metal-dependent phosphoesterase TrpH
MKVDLHIHTRHSHDSFLAPEIIVGTCRKKDIGAIAITDHQAIEGALEVREVAPFPVIVGEEIRTKQGEVMGLFLEERIEPRETLEEAIEAIREQNGLVCVPHPLDRVRRSAMGMRNLQRILDKVDIIEVMNSRVTFPEDNEDAQELAEERGIAMGAGSDAHVAWEIGKAYVEMPPFNGREDFLEALRQGEIRGEVSGPFVHVFSTLNKMRRRIGL